MAGTAFLVRRRVRGEYNLDEIPDPGGQYAASFATRPEAEAHARRLGRAEVLANGAEYDLFGEGLAAATSMPEPVFRDWLMDAGIDPPGPVPRDPDHDDREYEWETARVWGPWWTDAAPPTGPLTPDQVLRVLEALDRRAFWVYEVVAAEAAGLQSRRATTAFAVVHQSWEYGDDFYYGSNDALVVYRTRAAAEAERQRREEARGPMREWNGGPNAFVVVELQVDPEG